MQIFNEETVRESCLKYFNGDELAATVWMNKYNLKNEQNQFVENGPLDRFRAIAKEIARIESHYPNPVLTEDTVYKFFRDRKILPGGSALAGIGNDYSVTSLGNCFIISGNNEDSYGSILRNDQEIVQIAKRRGGVGLDISHLRPKGWPVRNAAGSSSGSVSFMPRFSHSAREVAQDGRRGALMLTIHINHPDALDFITAKDDETSVTGANISIKLTDDFMRTVEVDGIHQFRYPITAPFNHNIVGELNKPIFENGVLYFNMPARDVFNKIVEVNHRRAEPGILFWDTIKKESPTEGYPEFKTESTNPCGEIPLSPYDSCRLLSINLTAHVSNPFSSKASINVESIQHTIEYAVRIMDNIVDLEIEKLKSIITKIESDPESPETKAIELNLWKRILQSTERGRRIGISLIGHGDMFAMLGLEYDSNTALNHARFLHKLHAGLSYETSIKLASSRGAFPAFDSSRDGGEFLKRLGNYTGVPRRHIALLTIPPSGSLSILLNNQSSGIEPVFAPWYERSRKVGDDEEYDYIDKVGDKWKRYFVFHRHFVDWAHFWGLSEKDLLRNKELYFKESPYYGSTSHEIDPTAKVRLQGAIQKYVDHAISMTTNLPESASTDAVEEIYFTAWREGCKGATIYREGSRAGVLNKTVEEKAKLVLHDAPKRPRELPCDVYHPTIRGQRYVVMVGIMDDKPYEVFALKIRDGFSVSTSITEGIIRKQKSKHWQLLDSEHNVLVENIIEQFEIPEYGTVTKLASLALRTGAHVNFVIKVLNNNDGIITDYAKVIARQLKKYAKIEDNGTACPICGEPMVVEGGCKQCKNPECGYSACG